MLTDNEREWLEKRGRRRRYCRHCGKDRICTNINSFGCLCPTEDADFKDVAKFEARVAARLASILPREILRCISESAAHRKLDLWGMRLKWARLAVEEEMDADGK